MPFSHFELHEQFLEMRDSGLKDLIGYGNKYLHAFLSSSSNPERSEWLFDALREWSEECELPPGCKTIQFDKWTESPERREQLWHLFAFVAEKIRVLEPPSEGIIALESERVQKFILDPGEGDLPERSIWHKK